MFAQHYNNKCTKKLNCFQGGLALNKEQKKLMYNLSVIEDGIYQELMKLHNNEKANKENLSLYLKLLTEAIELNDK